MSNVGHRPACRLPRLESGFRRCAVVLRRERNHVLHRRFEMLCYPKASQSIATGG